MGNQIPARAVEVKVKPFNICCLAILTLHWNFELRNCYTWKLTLKI
jgi:hypothetical protein